MICYIIDLFWLAHPIRGQGMVYMSADSTSKEILALASATQEMKKLCRPLEKYNIKHFSFIRSFDDGRFVNFSNIDNWIEHYYRKKLYTTSCFENHPSEYFSHIYLWDDQLQGKVIETGHETFNSYHGLTIIDRKYDYTSFYFFSTEKHHNYIRNFYINHLSSLYEFLHQFEKDSKDLIAKNIIPHRKNLYEKIYIQNELPNATTVKDICKGISLNTDDSSFPRLSKRETECLAWLLKGLAAKEIAHRMFISSRTVEAHVGTLKEKFYCKTVLALVNRIYTQHHFKALALQNIPI